MLSVVIFISGKTWWFRQTDLHQKAHFRATEEASCLNTRFRPKTGISANFRAQREDFRSLPPKTSRPVSGEKRISMCFLEKSIACGQYFFRSRRRGKSGGVRGFPFQQTFLHNELSVCCHDNVIPGLSSLSDGIQPLRQLRQMPEIPASSEEKLLFCF